MFMPRLGQVPYYGQTGLNAGVMLMDIQAMNQWQPGWTRTCLAVADRFKQDIKLADQVRKVKSEEFVVMYMAQQHTMLNNVAKSKINEF